MLGSLFTCELQVTEENGKNGFLRYNYFTKAIM